MKQLKSNKTPEWKWVEYDFRDFRRFFTRKLIIRQRDCKSRRRNSKKALIPPHPLTNFEIEEYYESEPRFNGVYSRDNLPKTIKSGPYIVNLDEYANTGTHWIALYVKNNEVTYFDSFGVEHVPEDI